jgi:membrane protein
MKLSLNIRRIHQRFKDFGAKSAVILRQAFQRFNEVDAGEGGASMAFFAIFSLFPLLLLLVALGSFVLESQQAQQKVLELVNKVFPISRGLIEKNLRRVLELRGTVGVVGMAGLLWSATGFFTTLAYHINRAWPRTELGGFLRRRLVALGMVSGLAGLLVLSLVATAALNLLRHFSIALGGRVSILRVLLWTPLTSLIPWLFTFLMFLGLYRWVPNTGVRWSEAFWASLVAVLGVEITTAAFTWYLRSGFAQYELVYGSLGAMVALILWIYLNSLIALFGAHLSAAIAQEFRKG